MKKLLVVAIVMLVASMANAGMLISVDGVVNPPDSAIELQPSQVAMIDIHSDGLSQSGAFFLSIEGPGVFGDVSNAVNYVVPNDPENPSIIDISEVGLMLFVDMALVGVPIPPVPQGLVVDLIPFHCEGEGDVILTLTNEEGLVLDTQVIHQIIPEPMTMALLGLGALLIRRK
jgi:hypothetical protein